MPTLFEAGADIPLFILLFRGFHAPLDGFGHLGVGVSIHKTHVVNTVLSLCLEVSDEDIRLRLSPVHLR